MLFDPVCYMMCALFRLKNYQEFSNFVLGGQRYRLGDSKRNVFVISDFGNQVHHRMFDKHL